MVRMPYRLLYAAWSAYSGDWQLGLDMDLL